MEKRQLDLSAPLLSARRYSSPLRSSELTKPSSRQQSPTLNKPEPHGHNEEITKPASVPFHWEQVPGRPKHSTEIQRPSGPVCFTSSEIPKPPPGRPSSGPSMFTSGDQNRSRVNPFSYTDHARLVERLKESLRCDDSGSDDEGAFSDAIDNLSCTESGCHGSMGTEKHSGKFSVDPEMKELMLNRFLPAAKAAVLETPPQYDAKTKKEPPVAEKPGKKAVSGNKIEKPLLIEYTSEPYRYREYIPNEEIEDECREFPSPAKKLGKRWGILPRICVKSTLRRLNPWQPQPQTPATGVVRRLTRNALSGPLEKIACPVPHKKKFHSGLLSREISSNESKESDQFSKPRDSSSSSASSSLRRYKTGNGNLSPNRSRGQKLLPLPAEDSKIAASRKLFKALTDVSMNQKSERSTRFPPKAGETRALEADLVCSEIKRAVKEERRLESREIVVKSNLAAPLLPKSPSESWLWRSGNPCVHSGRKSPVRSNDRGPKGPNADPKWETIVKYNLRSDRVRDSQELTPRPPPPPPRRQANRSERGATKK